MQEPLRSIGLWGDGDELDAIADAERRLGFSLPIHDAPHWFTVGDIYDSIVRERPEVASSRTWAQLRSGVCYAVGANPRRVTRATTLIKRTNIWRQLLIIIGRLVKRSSDA